MIQPSHATESLTGRIVGAILEAAIEVRSRRVDIAGLIYDDPTSWRLRPIVGWPLFAVAIAVCALSRPLLALAAAAAELDRLISRRGSP